jgi:hypothetical protein
MNNVSAVAEKLTPRVNSSRKAFDIEPPNLRV